MKKSTKLFVPFLVIIFLLISGCSNLGLSNGKNDLPQKDITGSGLKINLKLDDSWISQKQLNYVLEIENTGSEEIKLTKSNVELLTLQVDETGTQTVFTPESIEKFYSTLFSNQNEIILPQNAKITNVAGQLQVADWYFNNLNVQDFEYTLSIKYDTKTIFTNNIEIDKSNSNQPLKVTDKLSQAAPVQITKISASPFQNNIYYIEYLIQNKGQTQNQNSKVKLDNFDFQLGLKDLTECAGFIEENNNLKQLDNNKLILNKKTPYIKYICKYDFSNYDNTKTTTTTNGEFTYSYSNIISGNVNLPTDRKQTEDIFN